MRGLCEIRIKKITRLVLLVYRIGACRTPSKRRATPPAAVTVPAKSLVDLTALKTPLVKHDEPQVHDLITPTQPVHDLTTPPQSDFCGRISVARDNACFACHFQSPHLFFVVRQSQNSQQRILTGRKPQRPARRRPHQKPPPTIPKQEAIHWPMLCIAITLPELQMVIWVTKTKTRMTEWVAIRGPSS